MDCLEVELTTANGQPALGDRAHSARNTAGGDDAGGPSFSAPAAHIKSEHLDCALHLPDD